MATTPCDPSRMANPLAQANYLLAAHTPQPAAARRRPRSRLRRPLQRRQVQRAQRDVPAERAGPRLQDPGPHPAAGVLRHTPAGPDRYLVDLPGYGYAKVPQDLQAHWQAFLDRYFRSREALKGLVVVMDIRHPLKDYDRQMLGYAVERGLPAHALLTKADKLSRGAAGATRCRRCRRNCLRCSATPSACRRSRASRSRAWTRRARW